jgi:hypothetical protein
MEKMPGDTLWARAEKMAGPDAAEGAIKAQAQELAREMAPEIELMTREAASRGIFNPDIHAGNIMIKATDEGVRYSWIDWGMAQRDAEIAGGASEAMMKAFRGKLDILPETGVGHLRRSSHSDADVAKTVSRSALESLPERLPASPTITHRPGQITASAKERARKRAEDLAVAHTEIWHNSVRGGRRHTRRGPASVRELSSTPVDPMASTHMAMTELDRRVR